MDESTFEIDQEALDTEWLEQPKLCFRTGESLADSKRELEKTKVEIELAKAELDRDIRSDPESFGISKVTESVVANTILLQPKYKQAVTAVIDLKHEVDVLGAAVTAVDHRKRALEKLVDLHGRDYFAEPRTSPENEERIKDDQRRRVRKKRKRRPE